MGKQTNEDEKMTVTLELDEGPVTCAIYTILEVNEKEYIVLMPLDENGDNSDGIFWFYGYHENPDDPNEEPKLIYIESEDEYEMVADAFDEYLDSVEYDELVDDDEELNDDNND